MKQVIAFVKEHVLVVVFCGTIIAALAGGWFASAGFNETVRLKAEEQARRFGELEGAEKGSITIAFPGSAEPFNAKGVINEAVVKQYGQVINVIAEDATKIQQAALARNLNGRDPYDPKSEIAEFLPRINDKQAAKVRYAAQKFVAAQYAKLLADVHAGTAPSVTEITKRLEGARLNFINQDLRKNDAASLSAEEKLKLEQKLASDRIGLLESSAMGVSFFCDPIDLSIPTEAAAKALDFEKPAQIAAYEQTLFDWQWRFWVTEDILRGLYAANQDGAKELVPELRAPVKHLISLTIAPMGKSGGASEEGSASENASSGEAAAFGAAPESPEGAETPAPTATVRAGLGSPQVDPAAEAARDYSKSFTGRTSNTVYDVRQVTLVFVAETAAIPAVLNALSRENFMTILDMEVVPADPFAAARKGFAYGVEPVSTVTLDIETIWFREWTAFFMPESVRGLLGVTTITAESAEASGETTGS